MAGILINFIFVPTILQIRCKENLKILPLIKKVISAPFVAKGVISVQDALKARDAVSVGRGILPPSLKDGKDGVVSFIKYDRL